MMKKVSAIVVLLIINTLVRCQDKKEYAYFRNIPTKFGIQQYIDLNAENIVNEVENFIGDSISSFKIKVDNLSEYHVYDSLESGRFYPEDEIIITNELKFYDYQLSFVPKFRQKEFDYNTKFVKGVLIHEFVHLYIYQFIYRCLEENIAINTEYINFNMFPRITSYYASEFIEEGICEYVVMKLKEGIFNDYNENKVKCPEDRQAGINSFIALQNTYGIKYQYSRNYVLPIFENNRTFRNALLKILTSNPPSYEELICPDMYYNRLMRQARE